MRFVSTLFAVATLAVWFLAPASAAAQVCDGKCACGCQSGAPCRCLSPVKHTADPAWPERVAAPVVNYDTTTIWRCPESGKRWRYTDQAGNFQVLPEPVYVAPAFPAPLAFPLAMSGCSS